jgi:hypothetical protein
VFLNFPCRAVSPGREWRFIEVNVTADQLWKDQSHIESLIAPAQTVMDLTIGAALWFVFLEI